MESELGVNTLKAARGKNCVATSHIDDGPSQTWVNYDAAD